MFQRITQKIAAALAKSPQGTTSLSPDNAQDYALLYKGKAYLSQQINAVKAPQVTLLGSGTPSKHWQDFEATTHAMCIDSTHSGFKFCCQHLVDPHNHVLVAPGVTPEALPILQQKLPTKVEKLKGTVAYLANVSPRHYGRWMRETLPLLQIYQQHIGLEQIDHFYIGDLSRIPDFISECFETLGISPYKIVTNPCKGTRTLAAFTVHSPLPHYYSQATYTYARQVVTSRLDLSDNCCYHPKVYIARGNVHRRQVRNQEAVYEVLRPYDFELRVLDNLKVREQAQIFYHAEVLIAAHGSALTNLMYGKPGNKVLEILPHDCATVGYFSLAAYAAMPYFCMYGKATGTAKGCNQDIEVDLELLDAFCRQHC
ncbi:glycosyltransferase family 61 protein [Microscilla marina]|uniref:EGF domain-specific O-linked N-acetylglucosamine transferase n=1 Tax=Microscilla marina ATCC 23134 TaxID=313606 RepID=A1ZFM0_MICM2|nr:glycosyltransferase family 61 protein [Microscilla marina]EAY30794.1 hypothetical protein M23134_01118 [Microscilla marina ATCC 23134]